MSLFAAVMEGDKHILYVITATVLFTINLVMAFRSGIRPALSNILLGGYFLCFFLTVAITYIVLSPFIIHVPHLFRLANLPFLMMMPFSWLYFRMNVKGVGVSAKDLVHLIPAMIYAVDYFPFFILSGSEKLAVLQGLDRYGLKGAYGEGWFMPKGGHNVLRYLLFCFYWVAQWRLLHKYLSPTPVQTNWLRNFLYSQLLIFLPAIFILIWGRLDIYNLVVNFFGLLAALIQGYMLLMYPEILYGFPKDAGKVSVAHAAEPISLQNAGSDGFKEIRQVDKPINNRISTGLDHLMGSQQFYLLPDLRLFHVAERLGVPVHKLSAYFSEVEQKNFFEYINAKRVEYFIAKIQSGEARQKTLEALSRESGFSSRATFMRAFRKETGKTPSEFIRELGENLPFE